MSSIYSRVTVFCITKVKADADSLACLEKTRPLAKTTLIIVNFFF